MENLRTQKYNNWNLKNSLYDLKSKTERTEERISKHEGQENLFNLNNKEKIHWEKDNEQSFRDLWDYRKISNIHAIGDAERGERENGAEKNIQRNHVWKLPRLEFCKLFSFPLYAK